MISNKKGASRSAAPARAGKGHNRPANPLHAKRAEDMTDLVVYHREKDDPIGRCHAATLLGIEEGVTGGTVRASFRRAATAEQRALVESHAASRAELYGSRESMSASQLVQHVLADMAQEDKSLREAVRLVAGFTRYSEDWIQSCMRAYEAGTLKLPRKRGRPSLQVIQGGK